jgi:hypothetical protein
MKKFVDNNDTGRQESIREKRSLCLYSQIEDFYDKWYSMTLNCREQHLNVLNYDKILEEISSNSNLFLIFSQSSIYNNMKKIPHLFHRVESEILRDVEKYFNEIRQIFHDGEYVLDDLSNIIIEYLTLPWKKLDLNLKNLTQENTIDEMIELTNLYNIHLKNRVDKDELFVILKEHKHTTLREKVNIDM